MHLYISPFLYHHEELYILLSSFNVKPKILAILENRIRKDRQAISNIFLQSYTYEHITAEASTGGALLYIEKDLTYKIYKDLLIYKSKQLKSIFIDITNKNGKNTLAGSIYKHATLSNQKFLDDIFLLLEELSFEREQIMLLGHFKLNQLNYNTNRKVIQFLDELYTNSFIPYINCPTQITKQMETLINNIFYNKIISN